MPDDTTTEALIVYAEAVRRDRDANRGIAGNGAGLERLLAPRMQGLIEQLLAIRLPEAPNVLPEYEKPGLGRPDLAFKRAGQPARAFIELKQPATSLNANRLRGHDRDQFKRFSELPLWGFCNFTAYTSIGGTNCWSRPFCCRRRYSTRRRAMRLPGG